MKWWGALHLLVSQEISGAFRFLIPHKARIGHLSAEFLCSYPCATAFLALDLFESVEFIELAVNILHGARDHCMLDSIHAAIDDLDKSSEITKAV